MVDSSIGDVPESPGPSVDQVRDVLATLAVSAE
jgi:hypothetical protein